MKTSTDKKAEQKEKETALRTLRQELDHEISSQLAEVLNEKPALEDGVSQPLQVSSEEEAKRIVEAILFAASKPVTQSEFKRVLTGYSNSQIAKIVHALKTEYEAEDRSFEIEEVAGGYECVTKKQFAPWIGRLQLQSKMKQATQSALETLAILAYKQPATRAEIEDLRGVDVSGVLSTLLNRKLVKIVGKKEVPGRPFLYGTTDKFLEHFGLKSLKDLPDISEIKSLVENSVKREELLRTETIVQADETEGEAAASEENGTQTNEQKEEESETRESRTDSEGN